MRACPASITRNLKLYPLPSRMRAGPAKLTWHVPAQVRQSEVTAIYSQLPPGHATRPLPGLAKHGRALIKKKCFICFIATCFLEVLLLPTQPLAEEEGWGRHTGRYRPYNGGVCAGDVAMCSVATLPAGEVRFVVAQPQHPRFEQAFVCVRGASLDRVVLPQHPIDIANSKIPRVQFPMESLRASLGARQ